MSGDLELVKSANPIQDVVAELYPLQRRHGRYLRAQEHDSLVVDTEKQIYSWNSKGETGDVIDWVMRRSGVDFKTAVEILCQRAKLPEPRWSREETEKRQAARTREEIFGVAMMVFQRWLWKDEEALAYCRGRGWTDETIRESGVGFSGRGTAAEFQEMGGEFAMRGAAERPEAVAILGFRGDVGSWAGQWGIEVQDNWREWKLVPGMMGKTRIVYPHIYGGRVRTLSARNILGAEVNSEGRVVKSFNLPVVLGGERQLFFNHVYHSGADICVVVEGQADAITLGQWGLSAVALAGTSWKDHEGRLRELRKRHHHIYIGLDADEAGIQGLRGKEGDWPLAQILGPMCRVIRWNGELK